MMYALIAVGLAVVVTLIVLFTAMMLRRVVPTNMVHIVQSGKTSVSYGRGSEAGNVYYAWPDWIPKIGVVVSEYPESIFDVSLNAYEAYDQDRLPFVVDVKAFFRIKDSLTAAQRVSNFHELLTQLNAVLQGSVRRILSTNHLESIMQDRSGLGEQFTAEVNAQLSEWGVTTVKTIEFMDLKDSAKSQVIHNIMQKQESRIDMESRVKVAENNQTAEMAEIDANRSVEVQRQDAEQQVGIRTAEKDRVVGIAAEQTKQQIEMEAKTTTERKMDVAQVANVRKAEIERQVLVVSADASKQQQVITAAASKETAILTAEADKETAILRSAGELQAALQNAQGIEAEGKAQGAAETARLMAPVTAQTTLADKIGANEGYQKYLIEIRVVEANEAVGIEQAKALSGADIKVIANGGDVRSGINSIGDIIGSKGGTAVGGMVSALAQNPDVLAGLQTLIGAVKKD